jgi:hypothetical protein
MSQTEKGHAADARPAPPPHIAAALAVAASCPSIESLGRHLADVERAYEAHDIVNLRRHTEDHAEDLSSEGQAILLERIDALRGLIATIPAATLADAAIQVAEISQISCRLWANTYTADEVAAMAGKIARMSYGILPIVAKAAGLDMVAMDWAADNDNLRVHRFAAVGVVS